MSDTVSREEVRAQLAQLRRPHVIREDSWYSCPLSDEPPSADKYARGPQVCDCGADAHNALLDRLSPILLAALDDAERIEWMIEQDRAVEIGGWEWNPLYDKVTLREAIDAARAGGEG